MKKENLKTLGAIIVLALIVGLVWYATAKKKENRGLEKVRVQAGWMINGEYANTCSALVNGYYKDEGLDVELIPGGPSGASFIISTNSVAQNDNIDIAIDGDIIPLLRGKTQEQADQQLKIKAFAAFWNEVPYGFIVREDSGLNSLKDLALKRKPDGSKYKIGVTSDSVIQNAIAQYAGVDVKDLDIQIVGFDATPFLNDQVDAIAAYWVTQAYEVEKAGIKYKFLGESEIPGFKQPSQVAIAKETTIRDNPKMLAKWLTATIKGSNYVIAHPAEAAAQIRDNRCGGPTMDQTQEEWLIRKSISLFNQDSIGKIDENQIKDFAAAYKNLNQIPRVPDINELFDPSILKKIY